MIAHWPQWLIIAGHACGLAVSLVDSGQKRSAAPFYGQAVSVAGFVAILYFGGFWAPLGWAP